MRQFDLQKLSFKDGKVCYKAFVLDGPHMMKRNDEEERFPVPELTQPFKPGEIFCKVIAVQMGYMGLLSWLYSDKLTQDEKEAVIHLSMTISKFKEYIVNNAIKVREIEIKENVDDFKNSKVCFSGIYHPVTTDKSTSFKTPWIALNTDYGYEEDLIKSLSELIGNAKDYIVDRVSGETEIDLDD